VAAFIGWDEKAGLHGMLYAPNNRRARSTRERRPAVKKSSTVRGIRERTFQEAKANDRYGYGRSLVVLLCVGRNRQNHSGTESTDDTGVDEGDILRGCRKVDRTGDRNTFAIARKLAVLLHRLWVSGEVYETTYAISQKAMQAVASTSLLMEGWVKHSREAALPVQRNEGTRSLL
jgi:hypothetical protein